MGSGAMRILSYGRCPSRTSGMLRPCVNPNPVLTRALSNWLGSKPFFLGASPTTVDCVLFGHLAQFLYIDIGFPQKTFMEDQCPNLVALVGRMKEKFWPSWDIEIEEARKKLTAS